MIKIRFDICNSNRVSSKYR